MELIGRLFVVTALASASLSLVSGADAAGTSTTATADNPEIGKQGEILPGEEKTLPRPYSKGVNLLGHSPIDNRLGNVIMAWAESCAYVADGISLGPDGSLKFLPIGPNSGVAIIDASVATAPRVVGYLRDKGALNASETLHAVTTKGRSILAASTYGGVAGINGPKEGWLSLYDVTTCAAPRLLGEIQWPTPVHTLRVSPSGRYVYGTELNPFTGEGGIQVMDIADPAKPRYLGKFEATRPDGTQFAFAPHELVFSPDEERIYVGVLSSKGGDLNRDVKAVPPGMPNPALVGRDAGGFYIFDNSDFAARKPSPKLRLIGTAHKAGWHSPARATIGGKPFIVNAGELGACPAAWPRITSIADEARPALVGEFRLAMNRAENCPPPTAMEKASGGLVGRLGAASTHFQDVDDAEHTRLGLFSFMSAGLRIVDLRKPADPVEIAYFRPGDPCMSHVRYVPESGQIWFACNASGFYVIEVKPEVRASAGLPRIGRRR